MQMYKVMMLPLAEEDIRNNTDYIAFEKKTPETALELAMGFRNTIAKLEFMPKQHELDEDGELAVRMIRKCYYKNYKIYFFIDEKNSTVYVLRVLHMLVNAKPLLLNMRFWSCITGIKIKMRVWNFRTLGSLLGAAEIKSDILYILDE